ncbi:MAG: efflux RND transporter periplasmic adaptor subunit [Aliiglaciecola sp.]
MRTPKTHLTLNNWLGLAAASAMLFLSACVPVDDVAQQSPQQAAPQVTVAEVVNQRLTEWDEFTGRIQAPQTVDLRPRVSGYIDFIAFEEGSIVEAGTPLFFIDNRPFKAEVKRLKASLGNAKSQFDLAQKEFKRAKELVSKNAISVELLDSRSASLQQAKSNVDSVSAQLDIAKLNLSYTRVEAPITGRVSNALITRGNYVNAGDSLLTTIVSTKEVYAYFDADEQTYLKYSKLAKDGDRPSSRDTANPVYMALASDNDYPYQGVIDFVDNTVNQTTGTIRGRAVFDNQDGTLIPGLFARIKLVGSASYDGILINDRAISTDLNNKFVLVLDDKNTVQYRKVELGEKLNGLRIIKSGLNAGEKIVVKGLQRVRPGSPVSPEFTQMASEEVIAQLHAQQQRIDAARNAGQLADASDKALKNIARANIGG